MNPALLHSHIIPLEKFTLRWLFEDSEISTLHQEELKPLDEKGSQLVWKYIVETGLHDDIPFKKGFFKILDKAKIRNDNEYEIKKWLYHRAHSFDREIIVSWEPGEAMLVSWKLFVKYFHTFYHGDMTVLDYSLNWALLCYHENELYFGTNEKFEPENGFPDVKFSW